MAEQQETDASPDEAGKEPAAARLLEWLAEKVGGRASVRTVYGEPVVAEGVTVIPVARVLLAFGGGGGHERAAARSGEGLGVGVGAHARPVGFIEIREGKAAFTPIQDHRPQALYGLAALAAAFSTPRAIKALARRR